MYCLTCCVLQVPRKCIAEFSINAQKTGILQNTDWAQAWHLLGSQQTHPSAHAPHALLTALSLLHVGIVHGSVMASLRILQSSVASGWQAGLLESGC